jgi:hypothetical protein
MILESFLKSVSRNTTINEKTKQTFSVQVVAFFRWIHCDKKNPLSTILLWNTTQGTVNRCSFLSS